MPSTNEEYTMRLATADDADRLVEIALSEWHAIYEGFREQMGNELFTLLYPDYNADKEGQIRRNIESGTCYVTECNGVIAGFIHFLCPEGAVYGRISNNAVWHEFRGRGIAGRQYEFAFEEMRKRGAKAVMVTTGGDEGHAPARRAYEKAGFKAKTESVTYYKLL